MGFPVFSQLAGRKRQPLVEFCLLFIREVYISREAFKFIFDRLALFFAKIHRSTPHFSGIDFGSRSPSGQALYPRTPLAGKSKTSAAESRQSKVSLTNLRLVLNPIEIQLELTSSDLSGAFVIPFRLSGKRK
jgi:hypothetical protein